jgi:thioredoxin 1
MTERLVILVAAVAVGLIALWAWRRWVQWRAGRLRTAALPADLTGRVVPQRANLLYFTTEQCVQCRFQQAPILAQLAAQVDVAVHKLDAIEQEALARFYGIMTVPTTVVLDRELRPVAINHGVALLPQLRAQLARAGVPVD